MTEIGNINKAGDVTDRTVYCHNLKGIYLRIDYKNDVVSLRMRRKIRDKTLFTFNMNNFREFVKWISSIKL